MNTQIEQPLNAFQRSAQSARTQILPTGETAYWNISPCVFMETGYPLQVHLSLKPNADNIESVFLRERIEPTQENAQVMVDKFLAGDGLAQLHKAREEADALRARFQKSRAAEQAREEKRDARRLAKLKAEGFTHRTVAWIHPEMGTDYQVELASVGEPTAADLKRLLRKSEIKTDYKIFPL